MTALLEVNNLETRFLPPQELSKLLTIFPFKFSQGKLWELWGESGSGKSISMLSLTRLLPSPPGKVTQGKFFEGENLLKLSDRQMRRLRGGKIGMIFQDPMTSLNPVLRVEKQLTEALKLHLNLDNSQAKVRAVELLEMVGIPGAKERIRNYPHQFSGGMRQRVMIAMGLACHPRLLIADEPTTALDVTIQAQIVELVKQLRRELGMAVIWITHDLALLAGLAQRILVMYAGQIVEKAPLRELYKNPRHPYTMGLLQSIPRLDQQQGERLQGIEGLPPDLTNYPVGCPFAARCPFVIDRCNHEDPSLKVVGEGHEVACWVMGED